jgi:hypothetical protein
LEFLIGKLHTEAVQRHLQKTQSLCAVDLTAGLLKVTQDVFQ